ncbi:MAG: tetratricopeptide repeat protein [Gammaproteobacteria bacterium]
MQRNDKFDNFIEQGKRCELAGEDFNAFMNYTRAMSENRLSFDAVIRRGSLLLKLKIYHLAINDFNKAVEVSSSTPEKESAAHHLARVYFMLSEYDLALDNLNRAIAFNPSKVSYCADRAAIYFEMGDMAFAVKNCIYALSMRSDDVWAIKNIRIIKDSVERFYQKVIDICTRAGLTIFLMPQSSFDPIPALDLCFEESVIERLYSSFGVERLDADFMGELSLDIGPGLYKKMTIQQIASAYIKTMIDPLAPHQFDEIFKINLQKATGLIFSNAEVENLFNGQESVATSSHGIFSKLQSTVSSKKRASTTQLDDLGILASVAVKKISFG